MRNYSQQLIEIIFILLPSIKNAFTSQNNRTRVSKLDITEQFHIPRHFIQIIHKQTAFCRMWWKRFVLVS